MNFRQEVIHPAVLRVGLQMGQRKIVGANARTAAMLTGTTGVCSVPVSLRVVTE